jgi:hypothetical protein
MIGTTTTTKCDDAKSYTVQQPSETFETIAEKLLVQEMSPPPAPFKPETPSKEQIEAKAKELAALNQMTNAQLFPGLEIFFPVCRRVVARNDPMEP